MTAKLPSHLISKDNNMSSSGKFTIENMEIHESGWCCPSVMISDYHDKLWLRDWSLQPNQGERDTMRVTRTATGYVVDISQVRHFRWKTTNEVLYCIPVVELITERQATLPESLASNSPVQIMFLDRPGYVYPGAIVADLNEKLWIRGASEVSEEPDRYRGHCVRVIRRFDGYYVETAGYKGKFDRRDFSTVGMLPVAGISSKE